jgi:hypothetical protein
MVGGLPRRKVFRSRSVRRGGRRDWSVPLGAAMIGGDGGPNDSMGSRGAVAAGGGGTGAGGLVRTAGGGAGADVPAGAGAGADGVADLRGRSDLPAVGAADPGGASVGELGGPQAAAAFLDDRGSVRVDKRSAGGGADDQRDRGGDQCAGGDGGVRGAWRSAASSVGTGRRQRQGGGGGRGDPVDLLPVPVFLSTAGDGRCLVCRRDAAGRVVRACVGPQGVDGGRLARGGGAGRPSCPVRG